ncbi:unnamed protein product [Ambrosiozyma monospora]|uniref:Unnamed protein product n=1 Tax=Ambrosiozyma monospora TaxID=43982 RepID=A0ACB5T6Z1_AMBMO|nr:unnamed protein product [Ambrosiozyma monospora]
MQFKQFILFSVLSHLATALPIERRAVVTVYQTSLVYETVTAGDDSTPTSTQEAQVQAPAAKQAVATTTASSSTEEPNYTYFTWTLGDDLTTTLSFDLNTHTGGFAATFESVIVNTPSATAEAVATTSAEPTTSSTQQAVTTTQAPSTTSSSPSTTTTPEPTTAFIATQAEKAVATLSSTSESSPTSSSTSSGDFKSIMLDTTNKYRAKHGVDALTWDDTLEQYAQDYANEYDCNPDGILIHSGGKYGENLALGYGYEGAVDGWYSEGSNYTYGAYCKGLDHFTALVWKSTTKMGCATKYCNSHWGDYVICSYDPVGNVVGYCADNVLPEIN